ncbi:hypothetical protein SSABA_v1c04350 [Spiroplasma sabaudiense Ar-1343]|uniref:Uncharacterized protein n=1 Tax=Spiroplasma sabaudiense Ar-1343 TaxID=1276257 RepID=W6A9X3_9MOLU|nr:hypothetical protein [Spiroplasma sabaudiense]AHI53842.1 hypothetical protein SSABA_v1c04350 [Spiroplasma sabaudiense Ar-1343]
MKDLFESEIIGEIVKKLSNQVNFFFGFSDLDSKISEEEFHLLLFAIRSELVILENNKYERNLKVYKKINTIFSYILELKLIEKFYENNKDELNKIVFELYLKLRNFPFLISKKLIKFIENDKNYSKYLLDEEWLIPEQKKLLKKF